VQMNLDDSQTAFFNQVIIPTMELIQSLSHHPYLLEPKTNQLVHKFESIAVATYHFREKHGLRSKVVFNDIFCDTANAAKHGAISEQIVSVTASSDYEFNDDKFRFMKNTIIGRNNKNQTTFDAMLELIDAIEIYCSKLKLQVPKMRLRQSSYPFYDYAVLYSFPIISAFTKSMNIRFFKAVEGLYELADPTETRLVVFNEEFAGQDPTYLLRTSKPVLAQVIFTVST
jgi:hypothetical protein